MIAHQVPTEGPLLPWLAQLPRQRLDELLDAVAPDVVAQLERERFMWRLFARAEQLPPPGDWRVWGMQAGRGGGKTWGGANWTVETAERHPGCRIGLFGPTAAKVRDVMIEDVESGVLAVSPPWMKAHHEPSKRRVTFANGSRCITYSADNPDQSRGANLHFGWADEVGEWADPESWSNLDMALRKAKDGMRPRIVVTTTPRPTELIRDIFQGPKHPDGRRRPVSWQVLRPAVGRLPPAFIAWPSSDTVVTRWGTRANQANLSSDYMRRMMERYAGSRLGRQELEAEILEDTPGALWSAGLIDAGRIQKAAAPRYSRIAIAVDPSHGDDEEGDACGIVAVALGEGLNPAHGYVLGDRTVNASPAEWGRRVVQAYNEFRADFVVYESNDSPKKRNVVPDVIKTVDPNGQIRWVGIHASRDKRTRADPVASLYEQKRVHHVTDPNVPDDLALLEHELCAWDPTSRQSPNRLDALVHGLSYLLLEARPRPEAAPLSLGTKASTWRSI